MKKKSGNIFSIIREWTEGKVALPQFVKKSSSINPNGNDSQITPPAVPTSSGTKDTGGKVTGNINHGHASMPTKGGGNGLRPSNSSSTGLRGGGSGKSPGVSSTNIIAGKTKSFGFSGSRVIIKSNYVKGIKHIGKHLKYIENRQQQERSELFGKDRDNLDREWFLEKLNHYDNVHRIVISPEDKGLDLKELVRETMKSFEKDKDRDPIWIAAIHKDPGHTSHPHVHLVVSGTDKNGRKLRIERPDIEFLKKETSRYVSREKNLFRAIERVFENKKEKEMEL